MKLFQMVGDSSRTLGRRCTRFHVLVFIIIIHLASQARGSPGMYGVVRNAQGIRSGWSRYYDGLERLGYQTPGARRTAPAMCETDLHWKRLCVQCAKITKSPWAFPLCCNKDLSAPQFCTNLVQYGLP